MTGKLFMTYEWHELMTMIMYISLCRTISRRSDYIVLLYILTTISTTPSACLQ